MAPNKSRKRKGKRVPPTPPPPPQRKRKKQGQNGSGDGKDKRRRSGRVKTPSVPTPTSSSKNSGFEWKEGTPHPLLIPHVIENVISNLMGRGVKKGHIDDFRNCRLVCKEWKTAANNVYRKFGKAVEFGRWRYSKPHRSHMEAHQVSWKIVESEVLKTFLKYMAKPPDCPFNKYRFSTGFFKNESDVLVFNDFLRFSSRFQCVSSIQLEFYNNALVNVSKRTFDGLKLNLSSLEELSFHCLTRYSPCWSMQRMELTYLFEALLGAAVNLKKLSFSIRSSPFNDPTHQCSISKEFARIIAQKCPKTVKNLELGFRLTKEQLQGILDLGLTLDTFRYDTRGAYALDSKIFDDFLTQKKDSLVELELTDSQHNTQLELRFEGLEKLKWLKIEGTTRTKTEFSLSQNFPVLENLILSGKVDNFKRWLGSSPCTTLRYLELSVWNGETPVINLTNEYFPNLKSLHVILGQEGNEIIPTIFQSLRNLEELELTFPMTLFEERHTYVDSLFTGLTVEECRTLRHNEVPLSACNDPTLTRSPSIADMTQLKRLIIHGRSFRITRVTAILGFMKLPNLKFLGLKYFPIATDILKELQGRGMVIRSDKYRLDDRGNGLSQPPYCGYSTCESDSSDVEIYDDDGTDEDEEYENEDDQESDGHGSLPSASDDEGGLDFL